MAELRKLLVIQDPMMINVNLLIAEVTVPLGAVKLLIPMVGVGIAWAAILAMPYAMLAMRYLQIKRVFIWVSLTLPVAPQIVSGLTAGWILVSFSTTTQYIIVVAGVSMLIGASFLRERG